MFKGIFSYNMSHLTLLPLGLRLTELNLSHLTVDLNRPTKNCAFGHLQPVKTH